jgi:hypothetical protein
VAVVSENSRSTAPFRQPGGLYQRAALEAARGTSEAGGTLFVSAVSGNAVSDGSWQIDGQEFKARHAGGSKTLASAEVRRQAEALRPKLRRIIGTTGRGGSDVTGLLRNVSRLMADYPDRPRAVVVMTDGALNVPGVLSLYRDPPVTAAQRRKVISRLRRQGELVTLRLDGFPA